MIFWKFVTLNYIQGQKRQTYISDFTPAGVREKCEAGLPGNVFLLSHIDD